MKIIFLLLALGIGNSVFAIDSYDQMYLDAGAVNQQFDIINYDKYLNVTRLINNQFAKRLPAQVDNETTYTMFKLSRNGLRISLELDGINTVEELEERLDERLFLQMMKNRMCGQLPMFESKFFTKTTQGNVVYEINNLTMKKLKSYSINFRDCQ